MRNLLLLAGLSWLSLSQGAAQPGNPGFEIRPAKRIICPAGLEDAGTRVGPPAEFVNRTARRGQSANITVTYTGFTPQAQAAFQYAVDIWKSQLNSSVPIHVEAYWSSLGRGVLGAAGPTTVARNFSGAPQWNVWYPIAMAEKIAGQDLNGQNESEIFAEFSSDTEWYYGTDQQPAPGSYDLVSVVLHELCHGLGFTAGTGYDDNTKFGDYGFPAVAGGPDLPYTFATFIENAAGQRLTDARLFKNPSAALGTQFTGAGLYFNSPLAVAVNPAVGDKRPRLYAPATYNQGSSISHLNENTYRAGSENSLMTYQIAPSEAIHTPGPLVRKMFDEMGWFVTAIRHTPLRDSETPQNFSVQATVQSDGTVTPGSVKLMYSVNNGAYTTVTMTATGTAGQYQGTIPNPGNGATVRYYLSASDNETRRTYTSPGLPAPGITARATYQFVVGPDQTVPQVAHNPPAYLFANKLPYEFVVLADDNLGVASVSVEYAINGTARPAIALARQADGITYRGTLTTAGGPIVAGDVLTYRVIVKDQSARANQSTLGPYTVPIVGLAAAQTQYVNNFNGTNSDFVGNGFSITQPAGFTDSAIHSEHPYSDDMSLTYQLLVPIVVKNDRAQATIKFDEVVLVEPGEEGSVFGTPEFYDYVVVEGSTDGENWTPLAPGYDARDNAKWLEAYEEGLEGNNSAAVGTPALYAPRTINLQDKFAAGSTVQLRFRLYADDAANGWGWAIDNLNIQGQTGTATKADALTAGGLSVYPNPTATGQLRVLARLARPTAGLEIQVRNVLGQPVLRKVITGTPTQLDQALDLSNLTNGLYLISLSNGAETVTRRVVIQK